MALKTFSSLPHTTTLFHKHFQFTYTSSSQPFISILFPKSTSTSTSTSTSITCIHESHKDIQLPPSFSKRKLNLTLLLSAFLTGVLPNMPDSLLLAQELELQRYTDSKEGFTLLKPSSWTKVDKAGATVLFQEENMGSNNIGVVVNPVRLASLGEFGTPQFVADKLLQAERRKKPGSMGSESSFAEVTGNKAMDSAEKRLNELGYKQELRREMTMFKTLAISFSTMTLFTGITPLYGSSLQYAGPASLVWGWVVVCFFTWFVGIAMAEICSSFPTTGSLYFWAAHLAGPKWGPFSSWCCAWLETIGLIAGIGTQAYAGSQTLQSIILLSTGTNKGGGYFAPKWLFLCMYIGLTLIWAALNTFALEVIAFIDIISIWWQVIGGTVIVIMLPLVALTTKSASYVFTNFELASATTGVTSKPYAVILSFLVSQYSLYGYDAAAHLTEETKGADKNGPKAILGSLGIISVFGWAYILALTFSIQDFAYLYDPNNETAGAFVPAQILYDAFHGRYHNSAGAIILLFVIWGSFFFGGLSITTSAARVVYALSRDKGVPFSFLWRKLHPKHKVPSNAVWLCAAICILLGLPILKVNVVFTAITSICTIGWVGGYAVPIFARLVMSEKNFKPGPFYLGKARRPVCLVAFLWICYTCSVFLLPTLYPISWDTFNYAPVALGVGLGLIMLWWVVDARKWFKGPVRNIDDQNGKA